MEGRLTPHWKITVNFKDFWRDDSRTFEEKRDLAVKRINASRWRSITPYPDTFTELVEQLGASEDADEFDDWLDELYDLADADRVWIATT